MTVECARCGRAMGEGATICAEDASVLARALVAASGYAEDVPAVIARQARYGSAYPGQSGEQQPDTSGVLEVNRRNPLLAFGWQASIERPKRGALRPGKIPPDLAAAEKWDDIGNTLTTWARHICEERGVELPARRPQLGPLCDLGFDCMHPSCLAIRFRKPPSDLGEAAAWLATQTEWLRHRPEAAEAFDELTDACVRLARLVDRPGGNEQLVGVCDCGKILYAPHSKTYVECPEPTCRLRWDVAESRDILRKHLGDKLVTLGEAVRLAAYLESDRTQDNIRKLLTPRTGRLETRGEILAEPDEEELVLAAEQEREPKPKVTALYRFGDIVTLLAAIPRRTRTPRQTAGMGA